MSDSGYLAFETGGTKLVAGVAGADLRLVETRTAYREPGDTASDTVRRVIELGRDLKHAHEQQGRVFRGCGIGFGGYVRRSDRRPLANLHEPGWGELDVAGTLEAEFNLPVCIENDCKLAALAEAHFGAGRGSRSIFYMTIGTGVGGGIVRDGRIVEMSDEGEAEIGHMVVLPAGPLCACGNHGCVEAVCSGPGLRQLAAWTAEREPELWAASQWASTSPNVSSEDLMAGWLGEDPFARAVIERASECLAWAVAAAINLLAPDVFVVGGGVASGNPTFVDLLPEKVEPLVAPCFRGRGRIVSCELGESVVAQGAVVLAAQARK